MSPDDRKALATELKGVLDDLLAAELPGSLQPDQTVSAVLQALLGEVSKGQEPGDGEGAGRWSETELADRLARADLDAFILSRPVLRAQFTRSEPAVIDFLYAANWRRLLSSGGAWSELRVRRRLAKGYSQETMDGRFKSLLHRRIRKVLQESEEFRCAETPKPPSGDGTTRWGLAVWEGLLGPAAPSGENPPLRAQWGDEPFGAPQPDSPDGLAKGRRRTQLRSPVDNGDLRIWLGETLAFRGQAETVSELRRIAWRHLSPPYPVGQSAMMPLYDEGTLGARVSERSAQLAPHRHPGSRILGRARVELAAQALVDGLTSNQALILQAACALGFFGQESPSEAEIGRLANLNRSTVNRNLPTIREQVQVVLEGTLAELAQVDVEFLVEALILSVQGRMGAQR